MVWPSDVCTLSVGVGSIAQRSSTPYQKGPQWLSKRQQPPEVRRRPFRIVAFFRNPFVALGQRQDSIFDHDCGNERRRRRFLLLTLDALRKSSKIVPLGRAILRCLARNSCTYTPETWMGYVVDSP